MEIKQYFISNQIFQNYLYSGDIVCYSFSDYTKKATVHLKQKYPFPLTINAITLDVSLEDTNA